MKEFFWFCVGVVTGNLGIPVLWHGLYLTTIAALTYCLLR